MSHPSVAKAAMRLTTVGSRASWPKKAMTGTRGLPGRDAGEVI
jgi:hypothetical protein